MRIGVILLSVFAFLDAFGEAESTDTLRSLYAIVHPPKSAVTAHAAFEIEGKVDFHQQLDNSFSISTNDISFCFQWLSNVPSETLVGCLIRASGYLTPAQTAGHTALATNVQVISRGPRPLAVPTDAASLIKGTHKREIVKIDGLVSDICKDDVDPNWTLLTLICGNETVGCYILGDLTPHLHEYLGAEVTVTGHCTWFPRWHRYFMGPAIHLSDRQSIKIRQAPPRDPFAAPSLSTVRNATPRSIGLLGRRSVSGRVLAAWGQQMLLIRVESGDICHVKLFDQKEPPSCGESIDVSGFPSTDLYHLNLHRACWRKSSKKIADRELPPVDVTARDVLVDAAGRKRIRYQLHGRQIRLRGTVISLPGASNDNGILTLRDESFTVPINFSACPGAMNDLSVGCTLAVTGICVINTLNPSSTELVPGIDGFTVIVRHPDDIRILSRPSWWTPARLLLVIGILVAILCGILVWNLILRRLAERRGQKLAEALLAKAKANLRVGERTRLAVELHDTLVQNMTGVAIALRTRNYDLAAKTLDFCRKDLRNCLWDLRNLTLDNEDINAAIRKTLAPHAAGVRLQVRFSVSREKFTDNTTHAILCILRELTINAVRHGNATAIWVAGSTEGDHLLFSVRDDGCGFDPAAAPGMDQGHFGLQGIRDRVEGFEGQMEVESSVGNGTKVTISLNMSHLDNAKLT